MDRPYQNSNKDNVSMFVGVEVEHTPAHGKTTLFVVGIQSIKHIVLLAQEYACEHVYFGANQSFPNLSVNDADNWKAWENMIAGVLDAGYLCTLDLDVSCVEGLCESGLTEHSNFIPMISVKLPYANLLGYNATIKIDDIGFNRTNVGVWCWQLHDLKRRDRFTPWTDYQKDKVVN